ncbi:MAG: hypothetical protein CL808_01315 [Citromicrobium sp.]|nr:hypothetical protein [Citromicrobium sp.]
MSGSALVLDPSITLALLAAGQSRRFDGAKLEAMLGDRPLWHHAACAAERAGFRSRLLVCRAGASPAFAREGWRVVENPEADRGIGSSIRAAVQASGAASRLVVMLADMPFVESRHLRALALASETVFSRYPDGSGGVPAGFSRADFGRLTGLESGGAQQLAREGRGRALAPAEDRSLVDVDTRDDLARARQIIAERGGGPPPKRPEGR